MIPRVRFVVEADPLQLCRYDTHQAIAWLIQSILRHELGVTDVDVTVGAMPERLRCACGVYRFRDREVKA